MGWTQHHAIVVTSHDAELIETAHGVSSGLMPGLVTPVTEPATNGYLSFLVAPDGSKEGWEESDSGDVARGHFRDWLNTQRYEDGSTSLRWVEVLFASEYASESPECETRVLFADDVEVTP